MPGSRVLQGVLLVAACAVAHAAHARLPIATRAQQGEPFVPRAEVAKVSALGFDAVMADYYWLRAVQIVGSAAQPESHGRLLARLIDVTTTLDPWVGHPYRFAAVWLVKDAEIVREANRLLERGIAAHPDDWRNRFYLGFNHFYYLADNAAAAAALEGAVGLPGAPAYLPRLAARLRADVDGLDTAEGFLRELARSAEDPYTRAEYEKALDEIETERRARLLDAAREEYQRRHGRDIEAVADLLRGPEPVLRELPPELHDWEWVVDEKTGQIVSSWYATRYEPHLLGAPPAARSAAGTTEEGT